MSPNVPAVYDVFAVAIKEHEVFQQPQKCAGVKRHKGRKPDWCFTEAKPPTGGVAYTVLLSAVRAITIVLLIQLLQHDLVFLFLLMYCHPICLFHQHKYT